MSDKVHIIILLNPLHPEERIQYSVNYESGKDLSHYTIIKPNPQLVVAINGNKISNGWVKGSSRSNSYICESVSWTDIIPKPDDRIAITARHSDVISGAIALVKAVTAAVTMWSGAYVGSAAAVWLGVTAGWLTLAAIGYGMYALMTAFGPDKIKGDSSSPTYGWGDLRQGVLEGNSIPIIFGTNKMPGQTINQYTKIRWENKVNLYMMLGLGEGPITSISDIKINDDPADYFKDVTTYTRLGTTSDSVIPGFDQVYTHHSYDYRIAKDEWTTIDTDGNTVTKAELDFLCPEGLYRTSSKGKIRAQYVYLTIEYKKSDGAWTGHSTPTYTGIQTTPFRRMVTIDGLAAGQYQFRVKRTDDDNRDSKQHNRCHLTGMREIVEYELTYPGIAKYAIAALATDQLSNQIPSLSCIAARDTVTVYDEDDSQWEDRNANNPAWAVYAMLNTYGGISKDDIIYADFKAWADYCDEQVDGANRFVVNTVIDVETNLWDTVQILARYGRGSIYRKGIKYTVFVDKADTTISHLFTSGNIIEGSFTLQYLPLEDRANAIEISYTDPDREYDKKVVAIYSSDYEDGTTISRKVSIDLPAAIPRAQVIREAAFRLNCNQLLKRIIEFDADVEAFPIVIGDLFYFQHDVPDYDSGSGGRIVSATSTSVTLDREVTLTGSSKIVVRLSDDTIEERTISGTGTSATWNITSAWSTTPSKYDPYAIGAATSYKQIYRCTNITKRDDISNVITGIEYNVAVYTDTGYIIEDPEWSAAKTQEALNVKAFEHLVYGQGGGYVSIVQVSWSPAYTTEATSWSVWIQDVSVEAFSFQNDDDHIFRDTYDDTLFADSSEADTAQVVLAGQSDALHYSIDPSYLTLGSTYKIFVTPRGRGYGDTGNNTAVIQIKGKALAPSNVPSLSATWNSASRTVNFAWVQVQDIDLSHYEIREGTNWAAGTVVINKGKGNSDNLYISGTVDETRTYLIKAIDTSGIYSDVAASDTCAIDTTSSTAVVIPTGLTLDGSTTYITGDGTDRAMLRATWNANTEDDFYHYEIELEEETSGYVSQYSTRDVSYVWEVMPATDYIARIRAVDYSGLATAWSSWTATETTGSDSNAPATVTWPVSDSIVPGFKVIGLNWNDNSEDDLSHYVVQRSTDGNFSGEEDSLGNVSVSFLVDSQLDVDTQYWYRIRAYDHSGNYSASWSAIKNTTTLQVGSSDIAYDSILANHINVTNLAAISVDAGTLTGGTLQSSNWGTGAGTFMDLDNEVVKMGGSSSPKFHWNGSTLTLIGALTVQSGSDVPWDYVSGAGKPSDNATVGAGWDTNLTGKPGDLHQVFYQATAPSSGMSTGDYWIDSDDNKIHRYSGVAWVGIQDTDIASALSTAQSKSKTFRQSLEPSDSESSNGDIWIDSDDNKIYRYNGTSWIDCQDNAIATAQGTADGKIVTFYQISEPTDSESSVGDLWVDTDDGNKMYRYNGTAWIDIQDTTIGDAQATADGKIVSFYQTTAPTDSESSVGDIWFDTDDGNKIYRYNGTSWIDVRDTTIGDAGNKTFYQISEPSDSESSSGDLWVDSNDGNKIYRYNGTAWIDIQDTAIATAQSTADGKIVSFYQTGEPTDSESSVGDMWVDTDDGNKLYRYNGTSWIDCQDTAIVDAQATADGKIVSFYQTTAPTDSESSVGDIWFDTDDGNRVYRYTGTAWVDSQFTSIAGNQTYSQAAEPSSGMSSGDLWIDTDDGNKLYRYNGTAWIDIQDDAIGAAQSTADGKIVSFYQISEPTDSESSVGDLWIDTNDGNKIYRYNGTAWIDAQDTAIVDAQATADGKIITFIQTSEPTDSESSVGDLWFDSDDGNRMYRYNGTAWINAQYVSSAGNVTYSQATEPSSGMSSGDLWIDTDDGNKLYRYNGTIWVDIQDDAIGNAQSTADGKVVTFYQISEPTDSESSVGDLWIDSDDGNKLYRYNGTSWIDTQDTAIVNAQATADGKIVSFYQTTAPTDSESSVGDIWFDTDDGYRMYYYNGTSWIDVQDAAIATAQGTADGKNKTFYQDGEPASGMSSGDLWVDTNDGYKLYRYNGSVWVDIQDTAIGTAQSTADGKVITFYQISEPTDSESSIGDLWIDSNNGNKLYRYNGTNWIDTQDTAIADAQATADGKIVSFYQISEPTDSESSVGDLWVDTDDGNKLYRYNGTSWIDVQDDAIGAAGTNNKTFSQDTEPSDSESSSGDLWIDTNDGNKIYRYNGTSWIDVQDDAIGVAQSTADGKIITFWQISEPTDSESSIGDLWVDTDDGNKLYRYNGTSWVDVQDTAIGDAQATADGKVITFYQDAEPSDSESSVGDLWFDTDDDNKLYRYNGSAWVDASYILTIPAEDNLVGYWAFNEGTGSTAYDGSNSGNDGTITGATFSNGVSGYCLNFDGSGDYVVVTDPNELDFGTSTDFSVSVWVKTDTLTAYKGIVHKGLPYTVGNPGWHLSFRGDKTPQQIQFRFRDASDNNINMQKDFDLDDNAWHHIVVSVDRSSSATIYVDGDSIGSSVVSGVSGSVSNAAALRIGVYTNTTSVWTGKIDEVRVYNKALTGSEAKALYTIPSGGAPLASWGSIIGTDNIIQTFYQSTAPSGIGEENGDFWIDSDDNKVYRYNGGWSEVQDDDIAQALTNAATAQTTADGKIITFYQASEPTDSESSVGDIWLDSNDGNKMYRYNGTSWIDVQDSAIGAQGNITFYQAGEPTDSESSEGDLWVDTDDGNKMYRYNGTSWIDIHDTAIDDQIVTFYQISEPTGGESSNGDLWVDTDDGNKMYRYNGTNWVDIQDTAIVDAQSTADGKILTFYQAGEPTGSESSIGDIWFDTDNNNKPYYYNGTNWVDADYDVATWSKIISKPTDAQLFNNLIDQSEWEIGGTGTQGTFGRLGDIAENQIILGVGPNGLTEPLWECIPDIDSDADGGWNRSNIPIDHEKTYRLTTFVKRTGTTDGTTFLGCYPCTNLDDSLNSNPYFLSSFDPPTLDKWYLMVGLLHGSGYSGSDLGISGLYDPETGGRVLDGNEFKITANDTIQRHRAFFYYCTTTSNRQYLARPRFEEVNGNEPSLEMLMNSAALLNTEQQWSDITGTDDVIQTFYQASEPSSGMDTGDFWVDSDDNKLYRYSGVGWVAIQDDDISQALTNAGTAQATADGKIITFLQAGEPTDSESSIGDIWFDTDDDNKPYRYNGTAWIAAEFDVATWSKIIGTGKPSDNADVTDYTDTRVSNAILENNVLTIMRPIGATYAGGSSVTGALVITLPQSWTGTMMKMVVDFFNYTPGIKSFELHLTGYNYNPSTQWINESAKLIGDTTSDNRVRFGHDGTKCCIVIGETSSTWSYPRMSVRAFQGSFSNYAISQWDDGWSISVDSTLSGYTFTGDFSDNLIDANTIANQGNLATQDTAAWTTDVTGADDVIQTFYQASAPSTGLDTGDIWIDSDDNKMYRYNGAAWIDIQDLAIVAAAANNKTFYQDGEPTGGESSNGDLWIDTNDGNKIYRYNGTNWIDCQDDAIGTAQSTADGKIITFIQTGEPTGGESSTGDLWIDSNDGNKLYRYNGTNWIDCQDTAIVDAQTTADGKIVSFYQDGEPTDSESSVGDLWYDTNDDDRLYRYNGSAWIEVTYVPSLPSNDNLVAYWSLDNHTDDASGNGHHGEVNGTPTYVNGKVNKGLSFNLDNLDYVEIADHDNLDDIRTFSCWVNPVSEQSEATVYHIIVGKDSAYEYGLYFHYTSVPNRIYVWMEDSNQTTNSYDWYSIPSYNTWYHVVGIYGSDKRARLYINGVEAGNQVGVLIDNQSPSMLSEPVKIGGGNASRYSTAIIDEVKLYSVALTPSEIKALYQNPSGRIAPTVPWGDLAGQYSPPPFSNLIGYWPLDESIGTIAVDMSGNGNNGTLQGSMTASDWVDGKIGTALDFDGNDDYIHISNSSPLDNIGTGDFSVTFWMKASNQSTNARIFSKRQDASNYIELTAYGTTNQLRGYFRKSGGTAISTAYTDLVVLDNEWHFICWVINRTLDKAYLYMDGIKSSIEVSLSVLPDDISNTGNPYWGRLTTASGYEFEGLLDELRIYDKAISITEINALYANLPSASIGAGSLLPQTWQSTGATTINGGKIETDSILAGSISAVNLGAIKALLGTVEINTTGYLHTTGKTSFADTDAGFFLGYDATESDYVFNIGDGTYYLKWDGTDLSISAKMTGAQPGEILEVESTVIHYDHNTSWVGIKTITITRTGTHRIKFQMKSVNVSQASYGRVYKDGVAYGTEQSTTSGTYVEFSEDLEFTSGDKCQLYVKVSSASYYSYWKNFSVYSSSGYASVLTYDT